MFVGLITRQLFIGYLGRLYVGSHLLRTVSLKFKRCSDPSIWRYCPGPENPADLPTRGMSASELKQSQLWWEGPIWSRNPEEEWPVDLRSAPCTDIIDPGKKRQDTTHIYFVQPQRPLIDFTRCSKYNKLLRTIAWMKRFIYNTRAKQNERKYNVNGTEIQEAEQWLIKRIQIEYFPSEIH